MIWYVVSAGGGVGNDRAGWDVTMFGEDIVDVVMFVEVGYFEARVPSPISSIV